MNFWLRKLIRDGLLRQSLLWLLLLLVGVALSGAMAVPARKPSGPDTSERFPCENCPCGCATAEYCWDKCCCHSDREKLAWADRNGVSPPAFLVARVARRSSLGPVATAIKCPHCAGKGTCSAKAAVAAAETGSGDQASEPAVAKKQRTSKAVLVWKAAECRGVAYLWTILAAVYVSTTGGSLLLIAPRLGWISCFDVLASSPAMPPDPPIP